jgi:acetyl esterase
MTRIKFSVGFMLCVALLPLFAQAADPPAASPIKSFVYKKTEKGDIEIAVHYPPGWKESDRRPVVVFFFGSGRTTVTANQFLPQANHFASRGMVVAKADYRVKSPQGSMAKEYIEAAKSAVRWLRRNAAKLGIDPERIVASGGSAAGHIAACTALTPGLDSEGENTEASASPNALVLFNPVLRIDGGIPSLMEWISNDKVLAEAISPIEHLTKDSPSTLLLFGTTDPLLEQGKEFVKNANELGLQAQLFTAEGQGHGFFNCSPWLEKTIQRMDEFLVSTGYLQPESGAK